MINRLEKIWCELFLLVESTQEEDDVTFGQIFVVLGIGLCVFGNLLTLTFILELAFGFSVPKKVISALFYFSIFFTIILLGTVYFKYIKGKRYIEISKKKGYVKNRQPTLAYTMISLSLMLLIINLKFFFRL
jgi:uncharacterized membrane protein YidH (DUF202 family)